MAKYRKKPIVVEAFQITKKQRLDNSEWPNWLHEAWNRDIILGCPGCLFYVNEDDLIGPGEILCLTTPEGTYVVLDDDYIIQGIQGKLYHCKSDIFEQTYEKIKE